MSIDRNSKGLLLLIMSVLVTGYLLTSLLCFSISRKAVCSEIERSTLPLTSDNIYSEIQREILRPVFISSLMAKDTFMREWVVDGEKDPEKIAKYLKEIKANFRTFTSFFVSERTLNYYYGEGILKKVSPTAERDIWYFRVRQMKEDYEINVDPDLANRDAMTIFINYRVYDFNGGYIGTTGVGLTIESARSLIERYQGKYGGKIYFVDSKGEVRLTGSDFPKEVKNISQFAGSPELQAMLNSKRDNSYSFERKGEKIHVKMRYIPEFQWFLIVEQGESGVIGSLYRTFLMNVAVCGLATALIAVIILGILKFYDRK